MANHGNETTLLHNKLVVLLSPYITHSTCNRKSKPFTQVQLNYIKLMSKITYNDKL